MASPEYTLCIPKDKIATMVAHLSMGQEIRGAIVGPAEKLPTWLPKGMREALLCSRESRSPARMSILAFTGDDPWYTGCGLSRPRRSMFLWEHYEGGSFSQLWREGKDARPIEQTPMFFDKPGFAAVTCLNNRTWVRVIFASDKEQVSPCAERNAVNKAVQVPLVRNHFLGLIRVTGLGGVIVDEEEPVLDLLGQPFGFEVVRIIRDGDGIGGTMGSAAMGENGVSP